MFQRISWLVGYSSGPCVIAPATFSQ